MTLILCYVNFEASFNRFKEHIIYSFVDPFFSKKKEREDSIALVIRITLVVMNRSPLLTSPVSNASSSASPTSASFWYFAAHHETKAHMVSILVAGNGATKTIQNTFLQ